VIIGILCESLAKDSKLHASRKYRRVCWDILSQFALCIFFFFFNYHDYPLTQPLAPIIIIISRLVPVFFPEATSEITIDYDLTTTQNVDVDEDLKAKLNTAPNITVS
jgi:hypothetical protein